MWISLHDLVPILQIAVGPAILISGVGLLLLSMTNRLGRVIDRSRQLSSDIRSPEASHSQRATSQIEILMVRARLVRWAITQATFSLLFASALVITLFVAAVLRLEVGLLVAALFVCCMGSLIGSLVAFLRDINLSLAALKLELASDREMAR
jgi:Protein of unknown function (DUF2721)